MGYIQILRIKNWVKNFLIFIPFIFAAKFENPDQSDFTALIIGFVAFCLVTSSVYIINDVMDAESDKKDEHKKNRPIPKGKVKIIPAIIESIILLVASLLLIIFINNTKALIIAISYFILNLFYSIKLKDVPIVDITLLSLFFLLRIYYGAFLVNVPVSIYLSLTTLVAAYYLGISKRLAEYRMNKDTRLVLKFYEPQFLDDLTVMFQTLTIVFYSLWVINYKGFLNVDILCISIPFVIIILIYYKYLVSTSGLSNPVDILFKYKLFLTTIVLFVVLLYFAFIIR